MTKLIARLVLAALLFPLAIVLFFFTMMIAATNSGPNAATMAVVWAVEYPFIGVYWIALWYPIVTWTPQRIRNTVGVTIGAGLIGIFAGLFMYALSSEIEVAIGIGGMTPPVVWVLGTVLVWKETGGERSSRLARIEGDPIDCPSCGYDMRGLATTTCPECGITSSLQQILMARQDSHEISQHETAEET